MKQQKIIVRIRQTRIVDLTCVGCTVEQAREDAWNYCIEETEVSGETEEVLNAWTFPQTPKAD